MLNRIIAIALAAFLMTLPAAAQVFEELPIDHPLVQQIWGDYPLAESNVTPSAYVAERHDSTLSMLVAGGICGKNCPFRIVAKDGTVTEFSVCADIDYISVWHGGLMACDVNHEYLFDIAE